jgi:hypothetical protein
MSSKSVGMASLAGDESSEKQHETPENDMDENEQHRTATTSLRGSWWLTRAAYVRYIGFIYLVAFTVAHNRKLGTNNIGMRCLQGKQEQEHL